MLAADVDQGQKISKASVGLLLRHPFFGSLLYRHEVLITASVETAAVTTDRVILLNPEFVEKCTARQLEFLLAHEVMHIVFAHIARRGDRDPVIYNIACDAVINETLIAEGVGEFIAGGIRMLGAQYRTSESIYDEIASRLKPKEKTSPSIGQGLTLPLFPDDLEADGQAGGLAGASDDGSENGNDSSASTSPFIGELNIPDLPREARKMTQEEINEQIEEGKLALGQALTTARTCGNMSGGLARFIGSILESSMPWYELLERYMVSKAEQRYNWSRPDKRRLNIAYLPRRERFPSLGTVVIGVDVSGSISDIEIAEYLGHCERIFDLCHPRKVYVVYCTTQVEAVGKRRTARTSQKPLERRYLYAGHHGLDCKERHRSRRLRHVYRRLYALSDRKTGPLPACLGVEQRFPPASRHAGRSDLRQWQPELKHVRTHATILFLSRPTPKVSQSACERRSDR